MARHLTTTTTITTTNDDDDDDIYMSKRSASPVNVELLQALHNAERQSREAKRRKWALEGKDSPRKKGNVSKMDFNFDLDDISLTDDDDDNDESSDEEGTCGNCGAAEDTKKSCWKNYVSFCDGCQCDYCDECGFEGECGVCGSETDAWDKYAQAVQKIQGMTPSNNASNLPNTSLYKLVSFMEHWQEQVQRGEDQILCMTFFGGGKHDASDIMTDCGDAVRDEMNWCLKRAETICSGESTFNVVATENVDPDEGKRLETAPQPPSCTVESLTAPKEDIKEQVAEHSLLSKESAAPVEENQHPEIQEQESKEMSSSDV